MTKKAVALFTLAAFWVFSTSCVYRVQQKDFKAVASQGTEAKILALQTKSGDYLEFGEARPARIGGGVVYGEAVKTVEFSSDEIADVIAPVGNKPGTVTTKTGPSYRMLDWRLAGDHYICKIYLPVSVPVSEVQLGWVKTVNSGASFLQGLGYLLVIGLVIALLAVDEEAGTDFVGSLADASDEPPPPPVYRDFFENYFVDAELRGVAAGQTFTITEWTAVDCSGETGGLARFEFGNELGEPKSTDELKVVVVDHPSGTTVAPDIDGAMHTLYPPVAPRRARDKRGRDILPLVGKNDRVFWTSPDDVRDPKKKEELRDELVLEFPKPKGAKRAKLVVDATNTMWASYFAGRFLGVPGVSPVKTSDPSKPDMTGGRARDWYREDEFYKLRVWVETKNGWASRQAVYGGGPFVPRDRVYVLDVSDVPGTTLKVRLLPPANFWMIDRLAVDFSDDVRADVREVSPAAAKAPGLEDDAVMAALAGADGRCLDLTGPADRIEVTFAPPPPVPGFERSVFVRTVGRYEIRPAELDAASVDMARKMRTEPGFAARFALEEYQRWEAALRARLGRAGRKWAVGSVRRKNPADQGSAAAGRSLPEVEKKAGAEGSAAALPGIERGVDRPERPERETQGPALEQALEDGPGNG
jgi:hypothetical protein